MPDPVVSPADTIRRYIKREYPPQPSSEAANVAEDAVDEWEAAGERDRRQIARLTEALRIAEKYVEAEKDRKVAENLSSWRAVQASYDLSRVNAVLAGEEDARPTVEPNERITWVDVRPGDAISLLVMSTEFGLQREVRSVVAVDWPKITLAEGARCYEIDATKPDNLNRAIERTPRAAGGGDTE